MAGRPDSFFRRESILEWADDFNVSAVEWDEDHQFDQAYLAAVLQEGEAGTPVFGMRLMWESVAELSKRLESFYPVLPSDSARFRSAFGSPRYLYLTREDKVAQAVSLLRAEQSGLWHVFADGTERERLKPEQAPVYDANELLKLESGLKEDNAAWRRWFAQQEIEPLCITYEALSTEPQAVLATVLSFLGLDPDIAGEAKPITAKLADSESFKWATRFRKESTRHESST